MGNSNDRNRAILLAWAVLMLAALGLLLYFAIGDANPTLVVVPMADANGLVTAAEGPLRDEVAAGINQAAQNNWPLWISAMTLAVSVIGLISSALLGWRQEVREMRMDKLESERMRVELEMMQLEIEHLRREITHDT